jgi:arginine-tRNA-protein transferase
MKVELRASDYGPCPYLPGRRWSVQEFSARFLEPADYERLLASGWRRSGFTFYRDACPGCSLCVPLRLDSRSFAPTRSQRRLGRVNADLGSRLVAAGFSEERYALYRAYVKARHGSPEGEDEGAARAAYSAFLLEGPLGSTGIVEYRDGSGRLLATGYVDVLPGGLSSVYFAFDPRDSRRSLGTWSVLRELELARELGLADGSGATHYYLGFWVPGSPKMDYKASFRPFELARGGQWLPAADRSAALRALDGAAEAGREGEEAQ